MAPRPREPRETPPTTTVSPTTTVAPTTTTTVPPPSPGGAPAQADAALAAIMSQYPELAALFTTERRISALGVPGTMVVNRTNNNVIRYEGFLALDPATGQSNIQPKYFDGDQYVVATYGEPQRTIIAKRLQKAGLLSDKWRPGNELRDVVNSMGALMTQANLNGSTWEQTLAFYEQNPISGGGTLPKFTVSSPVSLKETFRNVAAQTLGRRDLPDEMLQRMVAAYQNEEKGYQQRARAGGTIVEPPKATEFAETKIEKQNPDEAMAYRFAQYAQAFEKALAG